MIQQIYIYCFNKFSFSKINFSKISFSKFRFSKPALANVALTNLDSAKLALANLTLANLDLATLYLATLHVTNLVLVFVCQTPETRRLQECEIVIGNTDLKKLIYLFSNVLLYSCFFEPLYIIIFVFHFYFLYKEDFFLNESSGESTAYYKGLST